MSLCALKCCSLFMLWHALETSVNRRMAENAGTIARRAARQAPSSWPLNREIVVVVCEGAYNI